MPLEAGQTLLHYRLGDILGQGGMGIETTGTTFNAGRARVLVEGPFEDPGIAYPYSVAPDGRRFVAFQAHGRGSGEFHQHLQLVLNWPDELSATFGQ